METSMFWGSPYMILFFPLAFHSTGYFIPLLVFLCSKKDLGIVKYPLLIKVYNKTQIYFRPNGNFDVLEIAIYGPLVSFGFP